VINNFLVAGLTKGIEGLFKKNKVTYVKGHGRFSDPNTIEVDLIDGGKQTIKTKNTIIASERQIKFSLRKHLAYVSTLTFVGAHQLDPSPSNCLS
jgi:hypothetical protein